MNPVRRAAAVYMHKIGHVLYPFVTLFRCTCMHKHIFYFPLIIKNINEACAVCCVYVKCGRSLSPQNRINIQSPKRPCKKSTETIPTLHWRKKTNINKTKKNETNEHSGIITYACMFVLFVSLFTIQVTAGVER